jgi:hypothetical protein
LFADLSLSSGQPGANWLDQADRPGLCPGDALRVSSGARGAETQVLANHLCGLGTGQPVGNDFTLEGCIALTMRSHRRWFNQLDHSLLAHFPVR